MKGLRTIPLYVMGVQRENKIAELNCSIAEVQFSNLCRNHDYRE